MDSIKDAIINVNENIYDYKLKDLAGNLYSIMDKVNSYMKTTAGMDRKVVNALFEDILNAMEKGDYLLVADILMFELLSAIEAR